ncbi:MAG: preprotein translocase subunit SecA [Crocinitomicaceae bacterium]|jgi:preprotein translocase subunit SecA|nr:preprotein translocase subunit SecA [Crocinitomicaceae bacterium]|tara:strand:+ start:15680 stop:19063 length:3384 start_codon:yes stop_codon:yes gene_type:complete
MDFITNIVAKFFGNKSEKDIEEIKPIVEETNAAYSKLTSLSNDELRARSQELRKTIHAHYAEEQKEVDDLKTKTQDDDALSIEDKEAAYARIDELDKIILEKIEEILLQILPDAFAVVKETARRFTENESLEVVATENDKRLASTKPHIVVNGEKASWKNSWDAAGTQILWNMIHYDVQIIGGMVLHQGKIAEMATGEGKTLVATLPVFLNALTGRGVHLVTVNDYLAKRDAEWNAPIFEFHGLTTDCIDKHQPNSEDRRQAYAADITYGTNNEFGFDYLRDNMATSVEDLVQRKPHYAIVDEVDSVLIDDARTPLIISGPTPKGDEHEFMELKPRIEVLVNHQKKLLNALLAEAKKKLADGADKKSREAGGLALYRAYRAMPKNKALIKFLSEPGIRAQLTKTEGIYIADQGKEMPFVDSELFFVIDEKQNSVEMSEKGIELVTGESEDANFFIMPDIGVEIDHVEKSDFSDEEKLAKKDSIISDYSAKSQRIHTVNQLLKAYAMFEKDVEYVVMENQVKIVDEQTGRIMDGRRYSDGLHQAIEAKENVKIEAATQTYATITLQNYFRMYHKLAGMTGTAETEAGEFHEIYKLDVVVIPTNRPIARDDRQDFVYKTVREKFNAVIDEAEKLVKEGRPVLVGTTSVEISELLSRMLQRKNIKHQVLNAKLHQKEADVVAEAGKGGTVTIATNMAGRGTDIKLSAEVIAAGGLAIIGTERHESRRVDRQLRGRAGRQGDPGSSQFFVSLEDNLMRMFGSDRVAKLMDRMGLEEGEVIQHSMISKSIERAQKKVEENNFGVRKRLLEYDDVMNSQREVIYTRRKHALYGERIQVDVANMMNDVAYDMAYAYSDIKDFESFKLELVKVFGIESPFSEQEFLSTDPEQLGEKLYSEVRSSYEEKSKLIARSAFPVIKGIAEEKDNSFKRVVIPFTDKRKSIQVTADIERGVKTEGVEAVRALEKGVILAMIDQHWKEHLREMDDLRQSVQSAVYEQKDPLLIYKFESFELFKKVLAKVNNEVTSFLAKASLPEDNSAVRQGEAPRTQAPRTQTGRGSVPNAPEQLPTESNYNDPSAQRQEKREPVRVEKKINRNDKVDIQHVMSGEKKTLKYKQAEPLIGTGEWVVVQQQA